MSFARAPRCAAGLRRARRSQLDNTRSNGLRSKWMTCRSSGYAALALHKISAPACSRRSYLSNSKLPQPDGGWNRFSAGSLAKAMFVTSDNASCCKRRGSPPPHHRFPGASVRFTQARRACGEGRRRSHQVAAGFHAALVVNEHRKRQPARG
eukprot:7386977-Prymnesium_polylepis.1